jgi:hypothetical protein
MMAPKKFSFLAPRSEVKTINGRKLKFFAVSTRTLFQLKTLAGPIAQSLVTLMSGKSQDIKRTSRDFHDTATGDMGQETVLEPLSIQVSQHRDEQRSMAVETLITTLTEDENRYILGTLICDSLREVFTERPVAEDVIRDFMDDEDMSLPTLVELLGGVVEVNKGAFGPLAGPLAAKLKEAVGDKLALQKQDEEKEEEKDEETTE